MKVKLIATLVSAALMTACSSTSSSGSHSSPAPELPVSPEMVNPIEDTKPGQGPEGNPTTPDLPVASNPIEGAPTTPDLPIASNPIEGVPTAPDLPIASNPIEGVPTAPDLPIASNPIEGAPTTPDLPIASNPIEGVPTTPDLPIASNPIEGVPTTPDLPIASNPIEGAPTTPDLPADLIPDMPTQGEHQIIRNGDSVYVIDASGERVVTASKNDNGEIVFVNAAGEVTIKKIADMPIFDHGFGNVPGRDDGIDATAPCTSNCGGGINPGGDDGDMAPGFKPTAPEVDRPEIEIPSKPGIDIDKDQSPDMGHDGDFVGKVEYDFEGNVAYVETALGRLTVDSEGTIKAGDQTVGHVVKTERAPNGSVVMVSINENGDVRVTAISPAGDILGVKFMGNIDGLIGDKPSLPTIGDDTDRPEILPPPTDDAPDMGHDGDFVGKVEYDFEGNVAYVETALGRLTVDSEGTIKAGDQTVGHVVKTERAPNGSVVMVSINENGDVRVTAISPAGDILGVKFMGNIDGLIGDKPSLPTIGDDTDRPEILPPVDGPIIDDGKNIDNGWGNDGDVDAGTPPVELPPVDGNPDRPEILPPVDGPIIDDGKNIDNGWGNPGDDSAGKPPVDGPIIDKDESIDNTIPGFVPEEGQAFAKMAESMTAEQKSNLRRKVSQIRDAVKARLNR